MTPSTDPRQDAKPQPRRVVGYVRLSRESDDTSSPAKQKQIIERTTAARALAHPGRWELIDIVSDIDVSASKVPLNAREGLAKVRAMIADGRADAVVVWRLDRLARSVIDYGVLLREEVDVVSCTEPLDTTSPIGQAMVKVLLVFAELESQTIGERLRSTIAYRVSQGDRWRGGRTPYGYKSVGHPSGDGKTLVIEPTEARYIREAADIVLGGSSLYSAVQHLNATGSTPRMAEAWAVSSLRVVLTGDSVLGVQSRHGKPLRDDDNMITASWEPILPTADVERLRAMLKPKPITESRRKASRMLSGLLVCGTCGRRLRVNSRRSAGRHVEQYGCRANGDGRICERPASINADGIEAYIADELLAVAGDRPVIERREIIRESAELASIEEAIAHTTDAMREPGADIAGLAATVANLVAKRDELAAQPVEPLVEEVATGETFRTLWEADESADRRRELVARALVPGHSITVNPIGRGYRRIDSERVHIPLEWPTPREHVDREEPNSSGPNPDRSARREPAARPSGAA